MTELAITPHVVGDGVRRLELAGEVNGATVEQLETAIEAALTAELVVDLAAVTFLDSAGIGVLVRGRRIAEALEVPYLVVKPRGHVRQVLALMGLLEHLTGQSPGATLVSWKVPGGPRPQELRRRRGRCAAARGPR